MCTFVDDRFLQSLTCGSRFNQSMDNVTLPSGLQSLTFGEEFDWSIGCGFFFRHILQNPSSDRDCISFCHLQLKKSKGLGASAVC